MEVQMSVQGTQGTQGGAEGAQGVQGGQGAQAGAQGAPAAPPPKDEVQARIDRAVAKALAEQGRELGAKLTAVEAEAKAGQEARKRLEELEAKDATAAEKSAKLLEQERQKAATREAELVKTLETTKTRADSDAINAALAFVDGKIPSENSPDMVKERLAKNCKRKDDGKVVWVDPETDQELSPEKALEAFLSARPSFAVAPASGSGATPGRPPGSIRKPIGQMSKEELKAEADRELAG
jgi:hypothetical protein